MRFICGKKELSDTVSVVQRAVSSKSSIPALEGILIRASTDTVRLISYDLELGIFSCVQSKVYEAGEIILNARIFSDIVRRLPGENVEIRTDDKFLTTISSGSSEYTILGIESSKFPELPEFSDGTPLSLPQCLLSSMIKQTIFAISTDESKPVLTGSLFDISGGVISLVSVDGAKLAIRTEKVSDVPDMKFVVPGKTLSEIYKILSADSDDPLRMSVGQKHILFEIGSFSVLSRLLEGEFINYRSLLNTKTTTEVRVNAQAFADSIDRASLLISERISPAVRCVFQNDRILVKCSTTIGKIYDEIPCRLTGDSFEIGFNNRFLLVALRSTDCAEVRLSLGGPLSPMVIRPVDGDDFIFFVLPLRLTSDE